MTPTTLVRAPSLPAPGSCRGQSSEGPFPDQLSFEFRQSREEREDQLSAGRRRVDAGPLAGEHPDPDVPVVEVLHQVDEMAEIATEAIEPPDDDHVSLPRRLEEGGEPRAVLTLSGRLVLVDRVVADAGLAQSIPLQVEALGTVRLRYPRVARERNPCLRRSHNRYLKLRLGNPRLQSEETAVPASIFSETELARWASFPEEIPGDDLIRAFTLTGADRDFVPHCRGPPQVRPHD